MSRGAPKVERRRVISIVSIALNDGIKACAVQAVQECAVAAVLELAVGDPSTKGRRDGRQDNETRETPVHADTKRGKGRQEKKEEGKKSLGRGDWRNTDASAHGLLYTSS